MFLDGDNRNFDPNNIERVPLRIMGQFNLAGGCEVGNPEVTKLRILLAKMKMARFDCGEKLGLVVNAGSARCRGFREERNRKAREYNSTPERRKDCLRAAKRYRERMKKEQPEKWAEMTARSKAYQKQWYKRKKEEKNDFKETSEPNFAGSVGEG